SERAELESGQERRTETLLAAWAGRGRPARPPCPATYDEAVPRDLSDVPAAVLPAAVLFDMDGTLVDTEPYWMRAEREIVARHGATWTHDDALAAVGQALPRTGAMLRDAGVPLEPAEIVAWLVDRVNEQLRERVPWRPGVPELLADLRAAGVPCVIVTMSYRSQAEVV